MSTTSALVRALEAGARVTSTSAVACALVGAPGTWSGVADSTLSRMFEAAVNQASAVSLVPAMTARERHDRGEVLHALNSAAASIGECSATQANTACPFLIEVAVWRVGEADRRIAELASSLHARERAQRQSG